MKSLDLFDYIIVGAGISGLYAAYHLQKKGLSVLLIEKSKSVGGRMATRRVENYKFDHGAQFIDSSISENSDLDKILTESSTLSPWVTKNDRILKASQNGMTQIPKFLARDLNIVFSERVIQINLENKELNEILCESQNKYSCKNVIFSSPLTQSLDILDQSNLSYPSSLKEIRYASAIVALFSLHDIPLALKSMTYLDKISDEILSISNQESKKVSPHPAFTMIMTPNWSSQYFNESEQDLIQILKDKFIKQIAASEAFSFKDVQIKKWRFSHPLNTHTSVYLKLPHQKNVYLIGDAFGGASVTGAVKSAHHLVQNILAEK